MESVASLGPDAGLSRRASAKSFWADTRVAFVVLLVVALALKATSFGDNDRHVDETFYFLVGQRMHEGLLPYVDVWDRKPLGLFLIYYLIAGLSTSVWAYQIAACLSSGCTAFLVSRIAARWAGPVPGLYGGLAYLLMLAPFEGNTGQAPDFYNPLIAGAVLLVARETECLSRGVVRRSVWGAMALCGLALTIKPTVVFESAFLGLWVVGTLVRARASIGRLVATIALAVVLGVLPSLLIAAFYWHSGHWAEFWHAMVLSNLAKATVGGEAWRLLSIALTAAPLLIYAAIGWFSPVLARRDRLFLLSWTGAATLGFASVPNFFGHYTLPLLVPLSVAAALFFARVAMRLVFLVALALYAFTWQPPASPGWTRESAGVTAGLADIVRRHNPNGHLLVYDGPQFLYALTGAPFLSPLAFPQHLNYAAEKDVSHLRTAAEIDRILAGRPGAIVLSRRPVTGPVNAYARARVLSYASRCRFAAYVTGARKYRDNPMIVFGDCGSRDEAKKKPA